MLSRFVGRSGSRRRSSRRVADGTVDILIGTHRILSKDIAFADLGLLVVDEEQRFGVGHKERIKAMRTRGRRADPVAPRRSRAPCTSAWSASATCRVIETPPEARLPIQTRIAEDDDGLVRDAINRELDRGGQVFYVHNRVETIEAAAERVRRLVPRAKVAIGHGQMAEGMLERVMLDFDAGRFDVLVCTTIIESGLDIPNANTIIISRADTLRARPALPAARTGGPIRPPRATPTCSTGAGSRSPRSLASGCTPSSAPRTWAPATRSRSRDLEIRGAGNILGAGAARLHGGGRLRALHADAGRGGGRAAAAGWSASEPAPVRLDLPGSAYLPDAYIADSGAKLEVYRRFAAIRSRRAMRSAARRPARPVRTDPAAGRGALPRRARCAWPRRRPACRRCAPRPAAGDPEVAALRPPVRRRRR